MDSIVIEPKPAPQPPHDSSETVIIAAVAAIVIVGIVSVGAIIVFGPQTEQLPLVVTILGSVGAVATALLAILRVGSVQKDVTQLKVNVDGRLTALLEESTKAAAYEATTIAERVAAKRAAEVAAKAIQDAHVERVALATGATVIPVPIKIEGENDEEK